MLSIATHVVNRANGPVVNNVHQHQLASRASHYTCSQLLMYQLLMSGWHCFNKPASTLPQPSSNAVVAPHSWAVCTQSAHRTVLVVCSVTPHTQAHGLSKTSPVSIACTHSQPHLLHCISYEFISPPTCPQCLGCDVGQEDDSAASGHTTNMGEWYGCGAVWQVL